MPDPDLPVLRLDSSWIESTCEGIPTHPDQLREEYVNRLHIPLDKAMTIIHVCAFSLSLSLSFLTFPFE